MFEFCRRVIGIGNAVVLVICIVERFAPFARRHRGSEGHQVAQLGRVVLDHVVGAGLTHHQIGDVANRLVVELVGLAADFFDRRIEFTDLGGPEGALEPHENVPLRELVALAAIRIGAVFQLIDHRHVAHTDVMAALEAQARGVVLVLQAPGRAPFLRIQPDLILLSIQANIESAIDLDVSQGCTRQYHKASHSYCD